MFKKVTIIGKIKKKSWKSGCTDIDINKNAEPNGHREDPTNNYKIYHTLCKVK